MLQLLTLIYRRLSRIALRQVFEGRMRRPGHPNQGRFLGSDVETVHENTWSKVGELLPEARLEKLPNWGNRHNVFLAVLTVAFYQALLDFGIDREYAMELFADVGWKLYIRFLGLPMAITRLRTSDPQQRMNIVLRMFLRFPFSAPGRPGYELKAVNAGDDRFITDWTYCPPFAFVKQFVEKHGDRGEVEAFFRSWCQFDWALAQAIVEGMEAPGWYQRPHTLSQGGVVCDMIWAANPVAAEEP